MKSTLLRLERVLQPFKIYLQMSSRLVYGHHYFQNKKQCCSCICKAVLGGYSGLSSLSQCHYFIHIFLNVFLQIMCYSNYMVSEACTSRLVHIYNALVQSLVTSCFDIKISIHLLNIRSSQVLTLNTGTGRGSNLYKELRFSS